ncbi:MAG: NCS2 family permease [Tepidisphaeraceae bacterium]
MTSLDRFFHITERKSTIGREIRGGVTTFLTMAYILLVNPGILSAAGMSPTAAATSTALAAGVCCLLMGLWANFPLALASGMGLNATLAFTLTPATGSWQAAMALIAIEGLVILLLVLAGLREAVMVAIPRHLRTAIGAGIGLFIAVIGLKNGKLIVADPNTLVTAGKLTDVHALITLGGLAITAILMVRKTPAGILIGVAVCTVAALLAGVSHWPAKFPAPDFSAVFQADFAAAMHWKFVPLIFSVMLVDFFDTLGTATAVAEEGDLMDDNGRFPKLPQVLAADSVAASVGGVLGASSVTSYIESAAGVAEGARTGLHTVVVGILFLLAILAAPLAAIIPDCATAPALILVGFLMMAHVADIDFSDFEHAIPAFLTILLIPLTFSIAHGVGYGFIAQVILSVANGHAKKVHPLMYGVAGAFVLYFVSDAEWFKTMIG